MVPRVLLAATLALLLAPTPLGAAPSGGGGPAKLTASASPPPTPTPSTEVSPDSPRTALVDFFGLCNDGHFDDAARYLDLPAGLEGQGPDLARKLKAVLDHFLWIDLEKVSALPGGVREDGLPPEVDEVGAITIDHGRREPVRLVRRDRPDGPQWAFSTRTVRLVKKG